MSASIVCRVVVVLALCTVGEGFATAFRAQQRQACKSDGSRLFVRGGRSDIGARFQQQGGALVAAPTTRSARRATVTALHGLAGVGGDAAAGVVRVVRNFLAGETTASLTLGAAMLSAVLLVIRRLLWKPSRTYNREENSVGREYDAWATEGILEAYWGEHIHLGYYSEAERARGYLKKDFIQAKYDFIDEMMAFGKIGTPRTVLDVGCGIGGTSRGGLLLPHGGLFPFSAASVPPRHASSLLGVCFFVGQVRRGTWRNTLGARRR